MENLEKPLRNYIRAVERLLACPKIYRSRFLADMEKDIRQFLLENDSASYSDMVSNFGMPEELAKLYLENVPPEELAAFAAKKKRTIRITYILLIVIVTVFSCIYFNHKEEQELDVIEVEESIEIVK